MAFVNPQTVFRSLGTDALGTLAAWNNIAGGSIASNLVTLAAGAGLTVGHLDWDDGTLTARFKWATNSMPAIFSRLPSRSTTGGGVLAWLDSSNFHMEVGFADAAPISTPFAPVNGTFYWMSLQMAGNIATARLFNDSAGSIGSWIATLTFNAAVGHSTPLSPTGCVGIGEVGGVAGGAQFGGAFANVFHVVAPGPPGWAQWGANTGEPAYAWSKVSPFSGRYSLSISGSTVAFNRWNGPTWALVGGTAYVFAFKYRTANSGSVQVFLQPGDVASVVPAGSTGWASASFGYTPPASGNYSLSLEGGLAGQVYYDEIVVTDPNGNLIASDGFEAAPPTTLGSGFGSLGGPGSGLAGKVPALRPAGGGS